ncbi:MAG: hypothetical protein ABSB79_11285 [Syntrophales bacterium]
MNHIRSPGILGCVKQYETGTGECVNYAESRKIIIENTLKFIISIITNSIARLIILLLYAINAIPGHSQTVSNG